MGAFNHPDDFAAGGIVERFVPGAPPPSQRPPLKVFTQEQICRMAFPPREHVVYPILREKGLAMLYAFRGMGKTFLAHEIAAAAACGGSVLKWHAPKARKVLIIDGEMPGPDLQERFKALPGKAAANLRVLPMDEQELGVTLNLAAEEDQKRIEALLGDTELLILDNRSTLVSSGRENDAESWNSMQSWLLKLRRKGLSVLILEHAGRNGEARGTSKREDVLDTVIQLKRGEDYQLQQGACFEVHLTKARGIFGNDAAPFEARLEIRDGVTSWHVRDLTDVEAERVEELTRESMSVRDIAEETGLSKSKINRIQAKLRTEGRL